jgi:membrane associated rhomboid family serine protease/Zn-finger nucleic acid-binding protein
MFACPHCQKALQPLRGPQGMVWTCPICKGRAASFGVLRKSFGTERVATVVNESFAERTERGDACPVCQGATARVSWMEQDRPLSVDVCRRCEFVWFPPGEYESLVPAPPMHRLGDVDVRSLPIEVREQIAMEKAREIARQANLDQDPPDLTWKTAPALFGFPVEIDAVGTPRTTPATYLLAALIAAVSLGQFLIQYRDQVNLAQMFGLVPAQAGRYFGLTFVTSFFLHAGIWHLVGNLYFLVVFGRHVEAYLGSWRWLLVTAVSALAGGLVDVLCRAHSMVPLIGASGGISGVLAFYAFKFPHAQLGMLLYLRFYVRWITIPAWGAFALWIVLQLWGAGMELWFQGNVASLAHLGGVVAGVGFWLLWRNLDAKPGPNPGMIQIQVQ